MTFPTKITAKIFYLLNEIQINFSLWRFSYMKLFINSLCLLASLIFSGCGGGGGGDSNNNSSTAVNSSSQAASGSSFLNRQNTPKMISSYMDLVMLAKDTSASIVSGDYYFDLPDGTYKEKCSNSQGSLELVVSGGGDNLKQKYINCTLLVPNELGATETISLSGQEDISVVRNSDRPSTFQITWKNYSIEVNNSSKVEFDGVFRYVGMLGYSSSVNYISITSAISINATFRSDGEMITARNVDFVFDFPAIFDRYSNDFFVSPENPEHLHRFTTKIEKAVGEISVNDNKSNFSLNQLTKTVTFSASNIAKAYLKADDKGFYFQLDENSDSLIDFNTFLSTKEYITLSDFVENQDAVVSVTSFPELYGESLPKGLLRKDLHEPFSLSRTDSFTINVQQLFTSQSGALLDYQIDGSTASKDWIQIESGIFQFTFPDSDGTEQYDLLLTARDSNGKESPPIHIIVNMNNYLDDTDSDGILDINDSDIDNDGIENPLDSFPKNPAETSDTDRDLIGDNSDPDIDNDGVGNDIDVYPKESSCHTADRGDQIGCYLTNASYSFNDGRIIYFIQSVKSENERDAIRFVKFDTQDLKFLDPSPELNLSRSISAIAYNSVHNKVLINVLVDASWKYFILNLDDYSMNPIDFPERSGVNSGAIFSEFGFFVMFAKPTDSNYEWSETYDHNGILIGSNEESVKTNNIEYSNAYLVQDAAKDFCGFSISINAQGEFSINGSYEDRYSDICYPEMEISPNGDFLLTDLLLHSPFHIYDKQAQDIYTSQGWESTWIGSSILYYDYNIGFTDGELVIVDFLNNTTNRLAIAPSISRYVVGDRVIALKEGDRYYNTPALMSVYDKNFSLLFTY